MSDRLDEIRHRGSVPFHGQDLVLLSVDERDWLVAQAERPEIPLDVRRELMLELKAAGYLKATVPIPPSADETAKALEVYRVWRTELYPKMPEEPSKERLKIIVKALQFGYTVEQLCTIIRWAKRDPFCNGTDPKSDGRRWDDFFTLMDTEKKIERNLLKAQRGGGRGGRAAGSTLMPDASKAAEARRL